MLWRLVVLSLILSGCASVGLGPDAAKIKTINWPVSEIRGLIATLAPAGQRAVSPNGRELLSNHFIVNKKGEFVAATDYPERFFARYLILGDRRPFDIEILVVKEKRMGRGTQITYATATNDTRLAKELATRLQAELTKRREDRNIIDDFRVF